MNEVNITRKGRKMSTTPPESQIQKGLAKASSEVDQL